MDFQISQYQIYYYTMRPKTLAPIAQILLYDTTGIYRGDLFFHRIHFPEEVIVGNLYDQMSKTFQLRMHESQLLSVVDTLRNERPCFIRGYDLASPILATGREVVGAGEAPGEGWKFSRVRIPDWGALFRNLIGSSKPPEGGESE